MSDESKVPAFDSAIGLAPAEGPGAVLVDKQALEKLNAEIKTEHADALRYHNEAAQVASLFAKRAIRPDEIAALRRSMFDTVRRGLAEVDQVIMGRKTWSATQTRLFAILTERVMPKLSNITIEDAAPKKLEDLTMEELEAIALGKKKADAVDAVIKEAEVLDEQAEKRERREAKRDVIRQLAYVDALDEAEKAYIARQIDKPSVEIAEESARQAVKRQPKHTPEQLENVRRARKLTYEDHWRASGMSEEEIARRKAEAIAKREATKAQLKAEKLARLAVTQGLDGDAQEMARQLDKVRKRTLADFRVHNRKGVRSASTLARQAALRERKAARKEERDLNPTVYAAGVAGLPEGHNGRMKLSELRALRPDLFVPQPDGLGLGLEGDDPVPGVEEEKA